MTKLFAAREFQQRQIAELKRQSFDELSRRPADEQLPTPPSLRGLRIFVRRKPGEGEGIQMTVEVQKRALLVFVESSVDGFEMLPNGKIIPMHDDTHED